MFWLIISIALFCAAAMAGAWLIQRVTGNAGWVDVVWTVTTGLAGVAMALVPLGGSAILWRQLLVAALAALWSARLAIYVALRVASRPEDVRYAELRREWGPDFQRRFFTFMMMQAAASFGLSIAILLAARNPDPGLRLFDVLAVLVMAAAILGEAAADEQMRRFRADPARQGQICDTGLWGLSRHPNYFFEWLGWCAYPLLAINLDGSYTGGWVALIGPGMMYYFLIYASGIPPLERVMLARRGDAYRSYQARVNMFVPWPAEWIPSMLRR